MLTLTLMMLHATPFTGSFTEGAAYSVAATSRAELVRHIEASALAQAPHHTAVRVEWASDAVSDGPGLWGFTVTHIKRRTVAPKQVRAEYVCHVTVRSPLAPVLLKAGPALVEGITADGKDGALLVTANGVIHLTGRDAWPENLANQIIRVKGTLAREGGVEPLRSDAGEYRQGFEGARWVLNDSAVELKP